MDIKTRYLVVRLDLASQDSVGSTFSNNSKTKYIHGYSGSPMKDGIGFHKIDCVITQEIEIGGQGNVATIDIYGMNESDINTFTRANLSGSYDINIGNIVTIYAGYNLNSDGLPPLVYCGYVVLAGANYNIGRDRKFTIHSLQFFDNDNINIKPYNPNGVISIDNLFRYLCQQGGYVYRGTNVTGNAINPILTGSIINQIKTACKKYGYHFSRSRSPDDNQNIIYISPINTALKNDNIVLSAKNNTMIGFPEVDTFGFIVTCYFNPNLIVGQNLYVESLSVPYINNKNLFINQMVHELHNRDENWKSTLQLNIWSGSING